MLVAFMLKCVAEVALEDMVHDQYVDRTAEGRRLFACIVAAWLN